MFTKLGFLFSFKKDNLGGYPGDCIGTITKYQLLFSYRESKDEIQVLTDTECGIIFYFAFQADDAICLDLNRYTTLFPEACLCLVTLSKDDPLNHTYTFSQSVTQQRQEKVKTTLHELVMRYLANGQS